MVIGRLVRWHSPVQVFLLAFNMSIYKKAANKAALTANMTAYEGQYGCLLQPIRLYLTTIMAVYNSQYGHEADKAPVLRFQHEFKQYHECETKPGLVEMR